MGLDIVEMVCAVEEAFGVHFPDEALLDARTVGDFFEVLMSYAPAEAVADRGAAWDRYLQVISAEIGVSRDELAPHVRFVRDLRLN